MGAVSILVPVVIGSWPAITAAVAGVAAALGLVAKQQLAEFAVSAGPGFRNNPGGRT